MLKKSLRTNYQRRLARPLTLADGTKLVTLRDAANVLLDAANARSGVPDYAIRLLLTAAETRKGADITAATDAVERVLRDRRCGRADEHAAFQPRLKLAATERRNDNDEICHALTACVRDALRPRPARPRARRVDRGATRESGLAFRTHCPDDPQGTSLVLNEIGGGAYVSIQYRSISSEAWS